MDNGCKNIHFAEKITGKSFNTYTQKMPIFKPAVSL